MRAIIFGASGMVGQGVLRECIASADVEAILVIGRSSSGATDAKVRELVRADLYDYADVAAELAGYDACFFCLGVSSSGMSEAEYTKVTYDLTVAAARAVLAQNPGMTFCFVSGAGTDATEKGATMWARVKGRAENAILALGFRRAFLFRPGVIQPLHGIKSKTPSYRALYTVLGPLLPVARALFPAHITTTENIGRAMIALALRGGAVAVLGNREINAVAGGA